MPLALAAALLLAVAGPAQAATPRTLVVRGQTLSPEGQPIAGARVQVRGTASVSALTDERGRYTISVPLGMPAALRQQPFRMEVRADAGGRRLTLAGGGQSLVLDASWQASTGRVRVNSNREAAAKAVATALEVDEVSVAWIEADFGGAAKTAADGAFSSEATLPGSPPAAVPAAVGTGAKAATSAPRNSAPAVPSPAPTRAPTPPDTARTAPLAASGSAATTKTVVVPAAPAAKAGAMAALAKQDSLAPRDSCRCSVRGTVEIDWKRPLEDHTPIRIELDAPGVRAAELSLFMGAPREFRFGPLPCGAWRLTVKARGKLRYTDSRGDSARVVPCAGNVETRVVLVPGKR